jgi:hypothetical protein
MSSTVAPMLSDEQVAELLALVHGADSVELKLTVPESAQRSAVTALEMDPVDAQIRQVYFFDTPDLALNRAGVVVRGRRMQRKGDDTIVKLRPVVPAELPAKLRRMPEFGVEVDAMPGSFVCSARLRHMLPGGGVKECVGGDGRLRKLFSKEQRAFFRAHAPEGIALDDLSVLGPIFVLKLRFQPREAGRKLVAELWLYPDDSRILELSTKCMPSEAFDTAAELRAFLSRRGVSVSGAQETKTKRALEFFSARLAERPEPAAAG